MVPLKLQQRAHLAAVADEVPEDGGALAEHVAGTLRPLPEEDAVLLRDGQALEGMEADHVVVA